MGEDEQKLISSAYEKRESIFRDIINQEIEKAVITDYSEINALDVITNLIAAERLELKFCYLPNIGTYHEKLGFLVDSQGDIVYFSGSANETLNGTKFNRESIVLQFSWDSEESKKVIEEEYCYFELLWAGKDKNVETYSFPDACKNNLFRKFKKSNNWEEAFTENTPEYGVPEKKVRPYQQEAINLFLQNDGRAFFKMATGTGKTYTAVHSTLELVKKLNKKIFVLVLVPLTDLQVQWQNEYKKNGIYPRLIGGSKEVASKSMVVTDYKCGDDSVFCICVYNSFFKDFYKKIRSIEDEVVLVVDEAHNLGPTYMRVLSNKIPYRLGLSATPERFSKEETDAILNYFLLPDEKPFEFSLKQAIEGGFLSRYEYHPILVRLTDFEMEEYSRLGKPIAVLLAKKTLSEDEKNDLLRFLEKRTSILKKASGKLSKLEEMVQSSEYSFNRAVVYCGRGKNNTNEDGDIQEEKNITSVLSILNNNKKLFVSDYVTDTPNRDSVLEQFKNGVFTTLVAIKCFDEGIDFPELETLYVLASDSSVRQTIQRRGRVLRKADSKKNIYDMVVLPPTNSPDYKSLVVNELIRVKAYSDLAENYDEELADFINKLEKQFCIEEGDYQKCKQEQQMIY